MTYITAAIAVAAFVGGFAVQGWRMDSKLAEMEATNAAAVVAATIQVAEESKRLQGQKDDAIKAAQQQIRKNILAADAARIELHRVRVEANRATAAIATATCPAVRDYATTSTSVFGECTVALEEMARLADGHAVDAKALRDAWPTTKETK
jgi:predicted negative regulator of RcsB-dependent stress response